MKRASIKYLRVAIAISVAAVIALAAVVVWRSTKAMKLATEDVRAENEFRFTALTFSPRQTDFETISSPAVFFQATRFQDHLYIAGPAGLLEYTADGAPVREYVVGRDLPSSPLIALASGVLADSRSSELLIATAGDGVLAFDGRNFRQVLPASADARAINAILPTASGHLLLGTSKRGVLVYDGKHLTEFH